LKRNYLLCFFMKTLYFHEKGNGLWEEFQ